MKQRDVATTKLRWVGDDLAVDWDNPALISLADQQNRCHYVSLAEALNLANDIEPSGLMRITSAACFAYEHGYLCAADAKAWSQWSAQQ
ncbi:Uncharacterised protein [Ralstonia pickettii]|nr:hypothetical protein DP23_4087 [Ralstonia pickettii]QQK36985.1 hypothetical protein RP6297_03223 [Ralstonia pickettii]SUE01055.1 Uncharacterised protein [Ralstonia pickettii]